MNCVVSVLILVILNSQINGQITDKQYASLPEMFYVENFDILLCMLLGDEALYCSIKYILEPLDADNPPQIWNLMKNISSIETNYRHDHLRHSICVPKTCPKAPNTNENDPSLRKAIEDCYNDKYKDLELKGTISAIRCQTTESKHPIDGVDILWGVIFIIYILFILYATSQEQIASYESVEEYEKRTATKQFQFLSDFSLYKNWNRLTSVNTSPTAKKLQSIQGIRFYSSAIVVISHSILGCFGVPLANTKYPETANERPFSILLGCGHLCMTTFFFISSFLLAIDVFAFLKDKKGLSFKMGLWVFAARIFRQLPLLVVIVIFHATWLRHLGDGPHWDVIVVNEYELCRKNWWTNFLFINTLVDPDHMCVQASWWMAVNTQFIIFSLVLIWAINKYETYFSTILGAIISFSVIGTFMKNYYYDFPALCMYPYESFHDLPKLFASPQIKNQLQGFTENLGGPAMGVAFGYIFNKYNDASSKDKIFNTKRRIIFWWLNMLMGFGCVIVPGLVILLYSNEHDAFWASVCMAVSRPLYSFAFGILLMGFSEGIGGIALRICQWSPTLILGRVTYSMYLVQSIMIMTRSSITRFPLYLSDMVVFFRCSTDMIGVCILAIFLTLFIELPVSALQKHIFVLAKEKNNKEETGTLKKE